MGIKVLKPIALLVVAVGVVGYFLSKQVAENQLVEDYINSNGLKGPLTMDTAIAVANQVRKDFNADESTFTSYDLSDRPFLREDVAFLLTNREGLCGEGTRVIAVILQTLGFDATRITLFNKQLMPSHTLVSVKLNGEEFLVDSINSKPELTQYLNNNKVSSKYFNVRSYHERFKKKENAYQNPEGIPLSSYWLYSYESLPISKFAALLGLDLRVFNLERPPLVVSKLAERPNMIMAVVTGCAFLGLFVLYGLLRLAWKLCRRS